MLIAAIDRAVAANAIPASPYVAPAGAGPMGAAAAVASALVLGVVAGAGMTLPEGLSSVQPILPETRFEWKENIEYAASIALSLVVGHAGP